MGFFTVSGKLVTYEQFKEFIEDYKMLGLK